MIGNAVLAKLNKFIYAYLKQNGLIIKTVSGMQKGC